MTLRERLQAFLNHRNLSQGKFEKAVGLSTGFVNNIGDGISTQSLLKILEAYPDLNATWLLTGVGDMELVESKELSEGNPGYEKPASSQMPADLLTQIEDHANSILLSLQELRQAPPDVFQRGTNVIPGSAQPAKKQDKTKTNKKQADR
jgi:transcriptional regulator with XRE-family HTH domain